MKLNDNQKNFIYGWVLAIVTLLIMLFLLAEVFALSVPESINLTIPHGETVEGNFSYNASTTVNVYKNSIFNISLVDYSASKVVAYSVVVPKFFNAGNYTSQIFVSGDNETKVVNLYITVPEDERFELPANLTLVLNTSSTGYIYIIVKNTGNVEIELITAIASSYLTAPNLTICSASATKLPVFYEIPADVVGDFNFNITINDKTLPVYLTITDNLPPKITEVELQRTIKAGINYPIKVKAEDNINISTVWVDFLGDVKILNKQGDGYVGELETKSTGNYSFSVYANDTSGNKKGKVVYIDVDKRGGYEIFDYEVYSIINSTAFEQTIFEGESTPLNATLIKFNYSDNEGNEITNATLYQVYLVKDNEKFILGKEPLVFPSVGTLKLGFIGHEFGYFNGELRIDIPAWIGEGKTIKFAGKVSQIKVPVYYEDIIGDKKFVCKVNFNTTLENSTFDCVVSYPIDTDIEKIGILLTKREYDALEDLWRLKLDQIKSQLSKVSLVMWGFVFLSITFLIVILYYRFIAGKIYWKFW